MHYKNGAPAKVGDWVKGVTANGNLVVGVVVSLIGGSETCNCYVAVTRVWDPKQVPHGLLVKVFHSTAGLHLVGLEYEVATARDLELLHT